jgi:hypothetical protein
MVLTAGYTQIWPSNHHQRIPNILFQSYNSVYVKLKHKNSKYHWKQPPLWRIDTKIVVIFFFISINISLIIIDNISPEGILINLDYIT